MTDNLKQNLFTYFKENLKVVDSTIPLDSVRILRFDTITKSDVIYKKIILLADNILKNKEKQELVIAEHRLAIQTANLYSTID